MSTPLKILLIVALAIAGALVIFLYAYRQTPVVYRYTDGASVEHSAFIIQNPFRERGPETQAESILKDLKDENCQKAMNRPDFSAGEIEYCEREGFFPIQSWSLMDREDFGSKVRLVYYVYRNNRGDTIPSVPEIFRGLVWIEVEKFGDQWRSISYETYY